MRKLVICSTLSLSILFTSCLGSFSAFNNLREWNQDVTGSKFGNNLIFWVLNIVPVYGLFYFGDVVLFNVIEFWGGENPIAMQEGDSEVRYVRHDGNRFKMTATKNQIAVESVKGDREGEKLVFKYNEEDKSWNVVKADGEVIKVASFKEGFYVLHMPDGEDIQVDPTMSRNDGLALIHKNVFTDGCQVAIAE